MSVALAQQYNTCVVSADSRQFYKELSIGTAKPTIDEQAGVPHFFIDSHSITQEVTAAQYEKEALKVLEREFQTTNTIILTGGSGMFIDALCYSLDPIPVSPEIKSALRKELDEKGLAVLAQELHEKDPDYYARVDIKNSARIIRALEVIRITGKPFSALRKGTRKHRPFSIHRFVIDHPRDQLYSRINERVDTMIDQGLVEEVKSVFRFRNYSTLNTIGYKEIFEYLDGNCTLQEAIDQIKQNTRRYAKRQITWFKRHPESIWIPYTSIEEMTRIIANYVDTPTT